MTSPLPSGWTLSASAFNLTPELIRAETTAPELALSLIERDVADTVEVELGQLWRGFPAPGERDTLAFREALVGAGGGVSIVGGSIDDWASATRRRTDDERYEFVRPQLVAAAAIGAEGVRLPIGQAGPALLRRLVPVLEELDLVLFEELQGQQAPGRPETDAAVGDIADIDSPHVRLLLDISMLMPSLPHGYLDRLAGAGVSADLVRRLRDEWREPATLAAVLDELRGGRVPGQVQTLFMNLLIRFGRSDIGDLTSVLPLLSGVHLKFWDLDDTDGQVSGPIRGLGAALRATGFTGTLCSEWGGHEWLDDDPWDITRRHLALARAALASTDTPVSPG